MKIVIVGGGTAGWITALMISKRYPELSLTVIESSEIGIIGVGESTTGHFTNLLTNTFFNFGCNHDEFMRETGATIKYGIKHKNWHKNGREYFGPIDGSWTHNIIPDAFLSLGILEDIPLETVSKLGTLVHNDKVHFNKSTKKFAYHNHAMHIDGQKTSQYFKKITLQNKNVTLIDSTVKDVTFTDQGFISAVVLEDTRIVNADFFIDCSGFARILTKKMNTKWLSYQANLPLDAAIPFQLPYKFNETPETYTSATALDCGWMWTTPLADRKGNGYVFLESACSPELAQKEIEQRLNLPIDPLKIIRFEAGRYKNSWNKNCLSIGFSFAFLEPLEATAIHSIIVQAQTFVFEYLKPSLVDTTNSGSIEFYNKRINHLYDNFRDFIVLHYLGKRDDTIFWNFYKNECVVPETVKNLVEMAKHRMPTTHDFQLYNGSAGWPLYSFILAGLGILNKAVARDCLNLTMHNGDNLFDVSRVEYNNFVKSMQQEMDNYYSSSEFYKIFYNKENI